MDEENNKPDDTGKQEKETLISKIKRINWRKYTDYHTYTAWLKKVNWKKFITPRTYIDWFKSVNWRRVLNPKTYINWFKQQDWKGDWQKIRDNTNTGLEALQSTGRTLIFAVICALILMCVTGLALFFVVVKGQERVMVPNVTGKELTEALMQMQVKELYPKIQLRYTNVPGDAGRILEQSPQAGTIVKAGRRINLVVSRGVVLDHVENYVGMTLDDVRIKLQTVFAGLSTPLIVLADPVYKADSSPAGTVLAQDPASGTQITKQVKVALVVSRGPEYEKVNAPDITGKSVGEVLRIMETAKVIFDFTEHKVLDNEKPGTVVNEQAGKEMVPTYSRISADFSFPEEGADPIVYGIFSDTLTVYPYPVPVRLEAVQQDGTSVTVISFNHPGGNITIPYAVSKGTTLVLTVVDKVHKRVTIQ